MKRQIESAEPRPQPRHDREKIWSSLLPLISSGLSLPSALARLPEPRPSLWWCKMAIRNDPNLDARYRAALELRADALADEISAIADEQIPAGLRGADASAWVQQQRLRIDAKKWISSKLFPRRWGDRVALEVDVNKQISITTALALADKRLTDLRTKHDSPGENRGLARIGYGPTGERST